MEHYFAIETNDSHLEHHGRKGMKWYQHIFSKDRGSGGNRKRAEGDSGATGKEPEGPSFTKESDGTYSIKSGNQVLVKGTSSPFEAALWESQRAGDRLKDGLGYDSYIRLHNQNLDHAPTPLPTQADYAKHKVARERRSKMSGKEAERDLDKIAMALTDEGMSHKPEDEQMRELNTTREFRATVWAPQDTMGMNDKVAEASLPYLDVMFKPEAVRKGPREQLAKACLEEMGYQKSFAHDPRILEKYSKQLIEAMPSEYHAGIDLEKLNAKHHEPFNGVNFRIV